MSDSPGNQKEPDVESASSKSDAEDETQPNINTERTDPCEIITLPRDETYQEPKQNTDCTTRNRKKRPKQIHSKKTVQAQNNLALWHCQEKKSSQFQGFGYPPKTVYQEAAAPPPPPPPMAYYPPPYYPPPYAMPPSPEAHDDDDTSQEEYPFDDEEAGFFVFRNCSVLAVMLAATFASCFLIAPTQGFLEFANSTTGLIVAIVDLVALLAITILWLCKEPWHRECPFTAIFNLLGTILSIFLYMFCAARFDYLIVCGMVFSVFFLCCISMLLKVCSFTFNSSTYTCISMFLGLISSAGPIAAMYFNVIEGYYLTYTQMGIWVGLSVFSCMMLACNLKFMINGSTVLVNTMQFMFASFILYHSNFTWIIAVLQIYGCYIGVQHE